jgi:uncharacterized damage-inducible protein DinB
MSKHSLAHHFLTAAYNNAWANHRLLRACCGLSHEEFAAKRVSFFPSIKATLNHILTVDWFYVELLEAARAGVPARDPRRHFAVAEPFEDCAALSAAQHASDKRLIALCESLADGDLDRVVLLPRKTGEERDRPGRILAHLFQHQVHHRGQAHAMLAGTSAPPPPLDEFYCTGEAHLRRQDFAELGFDEERIWGEAAVAP